MRIFNYVLTKSKNVLPEERLAAARRLVLNKCDFVIDVGANDGQWISEVKKHGYVGQGICIEPLKDNYMRLKSRNFENITYIKCAIGNFNGYTYINRASNNGLSSSILDLDSFHKLAAPGIKFINKEKVKILKLSKILKADIHKQIFIKIDAQGYEFEILKSINKKNFNNIYAFEVETNLVSNYVNSTLFEDIIKYLRIRGFRPIRIENGFGMPDFGQQLQADILFIKDL